MSAALTASRPATTPDASRRAPLVGLTGAPASGKSTVAAFLREAGCAVVDVDGLGHAALDEPALRARVVAEFGADVLRSDGSLDRAALADAVFGDEAALRRLEEIVHPRVRELLHQQVADLRQVGTRAVVLDVALLFEGGLAALCDVTVAVEAPQELRVSRAAARGWDGAELARRERRQLPAAEKRARADRVLANDGDLDSLRERTLRLLDELAPAAGGRG